MQQQQHGKSLKLGRSSAGRGEAERARAYVCPRCKWQFPNAHPSSKKRAAHRKHCGKIGVAVPPLHSDADSSLAAPSSARVEVKVELLLQKETRLESTSGGDKDIEQLIESGHSVEADNQSDPGTLQPSGKADCKHLDNNVQLQDAASLISEEFKHGLESVCISEDRGFACITVPDVCVHTRNAVKPDSKPCPAFEEKSESDEKPGNDLPLECEINFVDHAVDSSGPVTVECLTVVADANMKRNSEGNAPASFMHTDISDFRLDLGAPERHQPMDSVALPISFGSEVLEPDGHLENVEENELTKVLKLIDIALSDHIVAENGTRLNHVGNSPEDNCHSSKANVEDFQERSDSAICNDTTDISDFRLDLGAPERHQPMDSVALPISFGSEVLEPDGHLENVEENELTKVLKLIDIALSDHIVAENGTRLNHVGNSPEDNCHSSKANVEDFQERSDSAICNDTTDFLLESQNLRVMHEAEMNGSEYAPLNCYTEHSNHYECLDSSMAAQLTAHYLSACNGANSDIFPEAVPSSINYQFSGDTLVISEKEQPDSALRDALDVTTSKREITGDHCSSVHGPANKDSLEQLTITGNENGVQTDSNIDPNNMMEHSSHTTSQDGKEHESQGNKKNEIKSRVVTWKSVNDEILAETKKLHIPLKKLFRDETIGDKQRTATQGHKLSPLKDIFSNEEMYDGKITKMATMEIEHSPVRDATIRTKQKEWNSPAKLPTAKNDKEKTRGKQQWVPFMCCSTTAI